MTNIKTAPLTRPARKSKQGCCPDDDCGPGLKNNYYEGKRLTPDTFRVEQRYLVERRRLLNRAVHGWGVVYGFRIESDSREGSARRITVGEGLAFDTCGRELIQVGCTTLTPDDVIILDERGQRLDREKAWAAGGDEERESREWCWLLEAHYAEQSVDPVQVADPCRCDTDEWDHVCETVRYTLRRVSCEVCRCHAECELDCQCEKASGREGRDHSEHRQHGSTSTPPRRGGCGCICEHVTALNPGDDCGCRLREIEERCGHVRVDLCHGVPLACVEIVRDECENWAFHVAIDACGPRRFVKRNDLLFDLIQGCDLTRISAIGWHEWHRSETPVPFHEFLHALGYVHGGDREERERPGMPTVRFWVEFSRPVRWNTLRPDCFTMTALGADIESGWWREFRVPIVGVEPYPNVEERSDLVRGAVLLIDGSWLVDAVKSKWSIFARDDTRVEIEIHGDFIIDCNGQAVDANAIGLASARSGNGTPGGTFRSTFTVERHEGRWPDEWAEGNQGAKP